MSYQSKIDLMAIKEENARLRAALELCLTGGNHIANILIGRIGAGFSERYTPYTAHDVVREDLGAGDVYEAWCCWSACMRARDMAENAQAPQ